MALKTNAVAGAKRSPCAKTQDRVAVLEETVALHRARIAALEVQLSLPAQLELTARANSGGPGHEVPENPENTPLEASTGQPRLRPY